MGDERYGVPHNLVAHPLLCLPVLNRLGEAIHRRTSPMVPTWRARLRRAMERSGVPGMPGGGPS